MREAALAWAHRRCRRCSIMFCPRYPWDDDWGDHRHGPRVKCASSRDRHGGVHRRYPAQEEPATVLPVQIYLGRIVRSARSSSVRLRPLSFTGIFDSYERLEGFISANVLSGAVMRFHQTVGSSGSSMNSFMNLRHLYPSRESRQERRPERMSEVSFNRIFANGRRNYVTESAHRVPQCECLLRRQTCDSGR